MEKLPKKEKHEVISLVEQKRIEALDAILNVLDERIPVTLKTSFESNGREYALTSAEDCMLAFAQQNREAVAALYSEVVSRDDYRAEQATVKLLKLFEAYERTVALYAELISYYPDAAARVTEKLPPLSEIARHGARVWQDIR
jgi:hypothetical protein